jgi:hypothetical protein
LPKSGFFTAREQAALAWTESLTLVAHDRQIYKFFIGRISSNTASGTWAKYPGASCDFVRMTLPFCMMTSSCSCRQRLSTPQEDEGKEASSQIDQSGIGIREEIAALRRQ